MFGVCRELRATVRCQLLPPRVLAAWSCACQLLPTTRQPARSSTPSCPEACDSVKAATASTLLQVQSAAPWRLHACVRMLQMRTAMLTHFNLQTPHHEDARLRTPAPPRAKRVMLAQPSCRAAVGSASTADSMYASTFWTEQETWVRSVLLGPHPATEALCEPWSDELMRRGQLLFGCALHAILTQVITACRRAVPLPRRPSAPRALSFQDVSESSGDGRWQPHPIMPLSPASVAS